MEGANEWMNDSFIKKVLAKKLLRTNWKRGLLSCANDVFKMNPLNDIGFNESIPKISIQNKKKRAN